MYIKVFTLNPEFLKRLIFSEAQKEANKKEEGLKTWSTRIYDGDEYLFHTPDQWKDKFILECTPYEDHIMIKALGNDSLEISEKEYGYILGRFVEVLLVHFKRHFHCIQIK